MKLPDTGNDGSSRGTICHLILELLCDPSRKSYYDKIIKSNTIFCIPSIKKLVEIWAKRLEVSDPENLSLIDSMTINGLQYDYFGNDSGKLDEAFSEKEFNISVDKDGIKYSIRGFIDKLFLYDGGKAAIIRDFKTSKKVFDGKEAEDNLQDLFYSLAVKHLFPKCRSRQSEFLFLKFDLQPDLLGELGKGVLKMKPLSDEELEGFEYQLTEWQNYIDNFDKQDAVSNFAVDQYDGNFPPKHNGFCGKLQCGNQGKTGYPGQLKVNGDVMWHCPFKFSFDYWRLEDSDGNFKKSAHLDSKEELESIQMKGDLLRKMHYEGCPRHKEPSLEKDEFTL
tara:strand:+ start:4675 stop:5682 length:1008 start_codon:yes stop_codon:yes gene_type:complete